MTFLQKPIYYLPLIGVAVWLSSQIALQTAFNAHPDESAHAEAFCYYQSHLWPPDINADSVAYDIAGWNRVYTGEVVYWLYGRVASVAGPAIGWLAAPGRAPAPADSMNEVFLPFVAAARSCQFVIQVYRLSNTLLYLVTLLILFRLGAASVLSTLLGLWLLALPQVGYVYAYANSDAWGLSCSAILFVFCVTRFERVTRSLRSAALLGFLAGLVLLSKVSFWFGLVPCVMLVGWQVRAEFRAPGSKARQQLARIACAFALALVVVIAPLRLIYPLTQNNYEERLDQMVEARAGAGYKPSDPTRPGFRLAQRGVPFYALVIDKGWWSTSLQSFYGYFGYLTVPSPDWSYQIVGLLTALGVLCTAVISARRWPRLSAASKILLLSVPITVGMNIGASLYNSWTQDYQPQGRYLFVSIIPLAIVWGATLGQEPRWLRAFRVAALLCACVLSFYLLWQLVLQNPLLR